MARLEIIEDDNVVKSFAIAEEVVIGRSPLDQDTMHFLHLPDTRISRKHARITRLGWTFLLEDLGSVNGIILRGDLITSNTPCDLYDGDDIWIASYHLIFHAEEDKLTVQHGFEPTHLQADPSAHPVSASETVSVVIRRDDVAHSQLSTILDVSTVIRLPSMTVPPDSAVDQDTLRRLHAMCRVSVALGTLKNRDQVLQKILDVILEIFPAIDRAFILLCHGDRDTLIPAAAKKRHASANAEDFAVSQTIVTEVLTKKHAIRSLDTFADKRFNTPDSIVNLPVRSVMCVPLLVDEEEVLGLIQVDTSSSPHAFTDRDLEVLTGIGAQAAIAVKNAQLYDTIQQETARRTSLQRYFSPKLVDMFMSGGLSSELGGKAYRGTILFSDIIGFTSMSQTMLPSAVVACLKRYFMVTQHLIHEHGGNIDKCAGDDIMAFWSVPQRGEEDEGEAVRTALHMQANLWSLNLQLAAEGHLPLYMGVGLNTGEFVAGNIGSEDKIEFTLIGDSVNLAARIVKLAARYQVFISEATWQPIRHLVGAIQLPPRVVHGKSMPIALYSIRSIQHRTRSACMLALPCTILDHHGAAAGQGMLTEGTVGKTLRLFFSTSRQLQRGEVLTLQPVALEYHAALQGVVRVESCARRAYDDQQVYTKAILTLLEGEELAALLTPGNCVSTTQTWDVLVRA